MHLIDIEVLEDLNKRGFNVVPGDLGENITTRGLDLINLPLGTELKIGHSCVLKLTGARTPCDQIEKFQKGLMYAVIDKQKGQKPKFKAGVMAVVVKSGLIRCGDEITCRNVKKYNPPLPTI